MRRKGLTLLELLVVVVLLALLAMLVVPLLGTGVTAAEVDATYQTMQVIRDAIMGTPTISGYFPDMKGITGISDGRDNDGLPRSINDLLQNPQIVAGPPAVYFFPQFNPQTRKGWRGPYLSQSSTGYGLVFGLPATQPLILDSFPIKTALGSAPGSPIVIEWPSADVSGTPRQYLVRLRSRGPDGQDALPLASKWLPASLTAADWGDDLILYIRRDVTGADWTNYWELKRALQGN